MSDRGVTFPPVGETVPVGRVLGSKDATPIVFWVGIEEGCYLQLDDVVVTERAVPGRGIVKVSGVVSQVTAVHEGATFGSDVFLIADGVLPARSFEAAEVLVTRVEPEVFVPPLPGTEVRRAQGAERDEALYFDRMERKLPIGWGRDGEALYVNLDFLDGTRGAHVNISGISGVATKTSYATFLLHSVFSSQVLGAEAVNTKALVFNVKGEDLLFLDQPNIRLTDNPSLIADYARIGLPARPFQSVSVVAPPRPNDKTGAPDVHTRTTGVSPFWWTLQEFCFNELLPFVFAEREDERQQYTMVIHQVAAMLKDGQSAGSSGSWVVEQERLDTYDDLVKLVTERLSDEASRPDWAGRAMPTGTVNAFLRRLWSSQRHLGRIVRSDLPAGSRVDPAVLAEQVTVVDLHTLHDRAQRFVVGVTLKRVFEEKELRGRSRPLLFLVLDELNKYAPREGTSPIKEILVDVAERGRSLGIILVGAQQTASEVERRIVSNSSIRVVGRLDAAEAARPEYGFMPEGQRRRATIAKPGTMFVNQPELPVPLTVEFPFPAWATRPGECAPGPMAGPDLTAAPLSDDELFDV